MILAMVLPKHLQPIRIANALEYTAYQMGQINRKLDKLIAAVELMAKQAWDADKPTLEPFNEADLAAKIGAVLKR
jgi:hypothetical protein